VPSGIHSDSFLAADDINVTVVAGTIIRISERTSMTFPAASQMVRLSDNAFLACTPGYPVCVHRRSPQVYKTDLTVAGIFIVRLLTPC
jgi:hypothetical protein